MSDIFKIVPRAEWENVTGSYEGSAHDRADGLLHFSIWLLLSETLRSNYAGQDDLMLVAVDTDALGAAVKWEHSPSRNEDFPHLFSPLPLSAVRWTAPIA